MIKKYRKKPVVVEAAKLTENNLHQLAAWCRQTAHEHKDLSKSYITILTLEGKMRVDIGDYIIKGVAGEFYPCKPDIFNKTYELE